MFSALCDIRLLLSLWKQTRCSARLQTGLNMELKDNFKAEFKYFKKKCPPPDCSRVLDFSDLPKGSSVKKLTPPPSLEPTLHNNVETFIADLMIPPSEWIMHEVIDNPGLIFIRNPFKTIGQRYWIYRCLKDFTCQPNRLNIDAHNILDRSQNWWDVCHRDDHHLHSLEKKLRWATIGYHHDWDSKVYSENMRDLFPTDLAALSRYVNWIIGHKDNFNAEAAIVNFYHFDSSLSGHTDHSELDMSAPLFSFSFGQTAIFLIGGTSLDVAPTALYIRSGDIVIMSKYSRQCYHGIPRILPATESRWNPQLDEDTSRSSFKDIRCMSSNQDLLKNLLDESFFEPFDKYIAESRININVRQVLCHGETMLPNDIE